MKIITLLVTTIALNSCAPTRPAWAKPYNATGSEPVITPVEINYSK